jgi:hypothetical protein
MRRVGGSDAGAAMERSPSLVAMTGNKVIDSKGTAK